MDIFTVLAVPTRRKILELIAIKGSLTATEICENFTTSPPAISQHLKILNQTKILNVTKNGQKRIYDLNPNWYLEFDTWARRLLKLQEARMDRLEQILNQTIK